MLYLWLTSILWAFSFGLIKKYLTDMDPSLVSFLRLFISTIIFLPLLRLNKLKPMKNKLMFIHLLLVGAIQFGFMYVCYIYSFQFLKAHEIALFTILTPIYVVIINDIFEKKSIDRVGIISALLAIFGAGIIVYKRLGEDLFINGLLLVQLSNLCFAAGQIYYKNIIKRIPEIPEQQIFAIPYLGGAIVTLLFSINTIRQFGIELKGSQLASLIYLGVIASALGFFMWNKGVSMVKASTLAVMNNMKIPLAVLCSIFIFNESANWNRIIIGGGIMLFAVFISDQEGMKKYRWWRRKNQAEL